MSLSLILSRLAEPGDEPQPRGAESAGQGRMGPGSPPVPPSPLRRDTMLLATLGVTNHIHRAGFPPLQPRLSPQSHPGVRMARRSDPSSPALGGTSASPSKAACP